jgi:hypothetical protein
MHPHDVHVGDLELKQTSGQMYQSVHLDTTVSYCVTYSTAVALIPVAVIGAADLFDWELHFYCLSLPFLIAVGQSSNLGS